MSVLEERPVDLAREYGISEWRVQELRKRFGLAKHPIGMSSDEIDVAVLLFGQGLSFIKIGSRAGRDPKAVAMDSGYVASRYIITSFVVEQDPGDLVQIVRHDQ